MLITDRVKKVILCWIIAIVIPPAFILPMYFCTQFGLSNEFLVMACLFLGWTGLQFVTKAGTFDVFRYQIINWVSYAKKDGKKRYEDAYEYKMHLEDVRSEHRGIYLPWLIVGSIMLLMCILTAVLDIR